MLTIIIISGDTWGGPMTQAVLVICRLDNICKAMTEGGMQS